MIEKKQKFASQEEEETEPTDNEDVMIKLIRVIANLAISEQVGLQLSERLDLIDIILKILGKFNTSKYICNYSHILA